MRKSVTKFEILNESNREEIFRDLLLWMKVQISNERQNVTVQQDKRINFPDISLQKGSKYGKLLSSN